MPSGHIYVISDLHLGDGGARDNFEAGNKTRELRSFLDHVGDDGGELFILGDLFELWQVNLSRMLVRRRELIDQLATLPVTYVPGNHDIDLAHFISTDFMAHPFFERMRLPFVREIGGRRFRFFHGHEVDPFNAGDEPGFGRMLSIFAGIFEDQNGSPFLPSGRAAEEVLEQFGDSMLLLWATAMATLGDQHGTKDMTPKTALTPVQNPDRMSEHVEGVRRDRLQGDYDVAVLGHTHRAGTIEGWYFNSGSWTGAQNSFLKIDLDGAVHYLEWKGSRAIEHEMPLVLAPAPTTARPSKTRRPLAAPMEAARKLFPKKERPAPKALAAALKGLLALALGIGSLFVTYGRGTTAGLRLLVLAFGVYALIDGSLSLLAATSEPLLKRLLFQVRGVASVLLGIVVLRRGYVVEVFVLLVGAWALVTGILRIAAARLLRGLVDARWLMLVGGVGVVAGLVLLLLPASTSLLKFALAGYLCYYGVTELVAVATARSHPRGGVRAVLAAAA